MLKPSSASTLRELTSSAFTETGNKSIKNNAEIAKKVNVFFIGIVFLKWRILLCIFQIRCKITTISPNILTLF